MGKACHEIGMWHKKPKTFIKHDFLPRSFYSKKPWNMLKTFTTCKKTHLCELGFQALFTTLAIMGSMKKEYAHQASIVLPL
jgi:hypothetical protein